VVTKRFQVLVTFAFENAPIQLLSGHRQVRHDAGEKIFAGLVFFTKIPEIVKWAEKGRLCSWRFTSEADDGFLPCRAAVLYQSDNAAGVPLRNSNIKRAEGLEGGAE